MLVLYRVDDVDGIGEIENYKSFPSSKWMEENQTFLKEVLGNDRYGDILTTTISEYETSENPQLERFWGGGVCSGTLHFPANSTLRPPAILEDHHESK